MLIQLFIVQQNGILEVHSSGDQNLEIGKCQIGSVGRMRENSSPRGCNHLPWAKSGVWWRCHVGRWRESFSCLVELFEFVGFSFLTSTHIALNWLFAPLSKNHSKSVRQTFLWSLSSLSWPVARSGARNQRQENLPSSTLKRKKKGHHCRTELHTRKSDCIQIRVTVKIYTKTPDILSYMWIRIADSNNKRYANICREILPVNGGLLSWEIIKWTCSSSQNNVSVSSHDDPKALSQHVVIQRAHPFRPYMRFLLISLLTLMERIRRRSHAQFLSLRGIQMPVICSVGTRHLIPSISRNVWY